MDQFNLDFELESLDFDVAIEGVNCRMSMSSLLKLQSLKYFSAMARKLKIQIGFHPINFHASCKMVKISSLPDFEHGSLSPEGT